MRASIVPAPSLAARCACGDLFLFPSLTETLGNLTRAALAADAVRLASLLHSATPSVGLHERGAMLMRFEALLSGCAGTQVAPSAWNVS